MKEVILNGYVKVSLVEYKGFVSQQNKTYEKVGMVVNKDEKIEIPLGAKVWFDEWMCKKYPIPGEENKFEWYVPYTEIVKYELAE